MKGWCDMQVYVYKLPELPGSTRGYVATNTPLQPSSSTHNPMFGSGGLAATEGAEFIYVGSPVASQPTSARASLYGNASVVVYAVRPLTRALCASGALDCCPDVFRLLLHAVPHL